MGLILTHLLSCSSLQFVYSSSLTDVREFQMMRFGAGIDSMANGKTPTKVVFVDSKDVVGLRGKWQDSNKGGIRGF